MHAGQPFLGDASSLFGRPYALISRLEQDLTAHLHLRGTRINSPYALGCLSHVFADTFKQFLDPKLLLMRPCLHLPNMFGGLVDAPDEL